ncbi:MAG: NCS2 family permease [Victivallales bacterium]|nr:NCS2 family permease [Victivallales bacterium]
MKDFFKLKENDTNLNRELLAGLTTFLAMAYILAVNPNILSAAGMPAGGVFFATALASFVGTCLMAFFSNYPFALAPGMGLNAYFAYTVVLGMGYSWQFALLAVFVEGLIFLLLSLTKVRESIFNCIPLPLKTAVSVGIGLFIAFIALQNAHIIVDAPTLVGFQSFNKGNIQGHGICAILAIVGTILTAWGIHKGIRGSILIGILVTWVLGIIAQLIGLYVIDPEIGCFSLLPHFSFRTFTTSFKDFTTIFCALFTPAEWTLKGSESVGFALLKSANFVIIMLAFMFVDIFDTMGTLIGVSTKANMLDKDGKLPRIKGALLSDSIATAIGAIFGTSTVTTFVESASGVAEGGRTGLTALTTAFLFLISLLFAPIFLAIPSFATAPALIIVGFYMISGITKIDFNNYLDAIPAYLTILIMPFAYSISEGICAGIITWTILNFFSPNRKNINPLMYVLTILFLSKYVVL